MVTQPIKSFEALYSCYLRWFQEHAGKNVTPLKAEDFPRFLSFHEDVCENSRILLNRVYYIIPLPPSQSASGALKTFTFSELNLMEKAGDEMENVCPVEYRVE